MGIVDIPPVEPGDAKLDIVVDAGETLAVFDQVPDLFFASVGQPRRTVTIPPGNRPVFERRQMAMLMDSIDLFDVRSGKIGDVVHPMAKTSFDLLQDVQVVANTRFTVPYLEFPGIRMAGDHHRHRKGGCRRKQSGALNIWHLMILIGRAPNWLQSGQAWSIGQVHCRRSAEQTEICRHRIGEAR